METEAPKDACNYAPMGDRATASVASQGGSAITCAANSANQYTSITAQAPPTHDANGNLTTQTGVTYTWDSEPKRSEDRPTLILFLLGHYRLLRVAAVPRKRFPE